LISQLLKMICRVSEIDQKQLQLKNHKAIIFIALMSLIPMVGYAQTFTLSSTNPSIISSNINQGSSTQPIYRAVVQVTGSGGANFTNLTFTPTGSFVSSDINSTYNNFGYRVWASQTDNLASASQISNIFPPLASGSPVSIAINSPYWTTGNTYYLWITADISPTAVNGHTLTVGALTASSFTFTGGTKTGTMYVGGTQTIIDGILRTSSSTSGNFTVPADVTSIQVEAWGGGGKGGSRTTNTTAGGGGGGGGAYSMSPISVTPTTTYSYTVGSGSTTTAAGGDTYFINTSTLLAKGGGSVADNTTTGATGGNASAGVGTVKSNGGNGATAATYGGGGGSSAGTGANGNTAANSTGATAPVGGGAGGNGRSGSQGAGSAGSTPGGAGGGAYTTSNNDYFGGNGGDGQIIISYLSPITGNICISQGTTSTLTNSTQGGTWSSTSTAVATINASTGAVTGVSVGTSLITYTYNGMAITKTITVLAAPTATITNTSCPLVSDGGIALLTPVDYAVQFNKATNDYIDLGSKPLNNLAAFTLEGWIKYKASDITGTRIGLFGQNDGIEFGMIDNTNIQCYTPQTGGLNFPFVATIGDNNWHHIAVVGNSTSFILYVDGIVLGTQTFNSVSSFGGNVSNACIGQDFDPPGATGETFPGQIRRVGMWSKALSATEIAILAASYTHVYVGTETNLIAGYNFSEGVGTTLNSLPTGKNGTFVNSPTWVDLLTYSWTKSGDASFTRSTRSFSAIGVGDYTVTASNTFIKAVQTFTVNSNNTCDNYWVGNISGDWGDVNNWSAKFAPGLDTATGKNVTFSTIANNNKVAQSDLVLDGVREIGNLTNATTKRLIIPASKGLKVNGTISVTPPVTNPVTDPADLIYIQSNASVENGSLITPTASSVQATVEMYSKATINTSGPTDYQYFWQYFGIPVTTIIAEPTLYKAYVRRANEAGDDNDATYYWTELTNSDALNKFIGHEICQPTTTTYIFKGQLVNTDFDSGLLAYTTGAKYPGQHLFANSYTAAINVDKIEFGSDMDKTVFLYNTGSYGQWNTTGYQTSSGDNPGQYLSIPQNVAGSGGVPGEVPSMSSMLVKTAGNKTAGSYIKMKYSDVAIKNTTQQRVKSVDAITNTDLISTRIDLTGKHYSDRMWIFTEPSCTRNFDNGWDGRKMLGSSLAPQIYAIEPDGDYQVNSVSDMNNTDLAFQAGDEVEYTIKFTHENIQRQYAGVYLVDLVENKTVDVSENGSTYTFATAQSDAPAKRFKILTRPYEKGAPDKETLVKIFTAPGRVFVQNLSTFKGECTLYDIAGRAIKNAQFEANAVTEVLSNLTPGAYVVNTITNGEKVSKRVIVQ